MENIQDFLKEYSLLKHKKEADLNFFQIAGFPHYENVSSNILSFYFNDEYVLKSFLNCIPDYKPSIDFVKEINREERTENNKRIDIVISTNKYIIGIENKINAWLYNPIDDYYSYLNSRAKNEGKELLLIILSKNKIESNTKYKNVLYKDFSNELKKYYPELLNRLGYKYFFLLTEYIANIEFLEEGYSMNKEFIEIAKQDDNLGKIEQIMSEGIRLRNDLINTAGRILNDLQEYTKSFETKSIFKEQGQIFGTAMFQDCYLTDKKYNCTIDVDVMVSGFGMSIYECNKRFDTEFKNILMEILPDLSKDYDLSDRAIYKYDIKLEEYDKLIMLLKNIFDAFDKYIKSKNYGA